MNRKVNPPVEDRLVDLFFENSFLVEREERCSLVSITSCRDDSPIYSETLIL
jgi:hypothetical protein